MNVSWNRPWEGVSGQVITYSSHTITIHHAGPKSPKRFLAQLRFAFSLLRQWQSMSKKKEIVDQAGRGGGGGGGGVWTPRQISRDIDFIFNKILKKSMSLEV